MSYIELLPDDLILSILEARCDDIEDAIMILENHIDFCNDVINDVNSDIDTFSYYSSTDDDDDEENIELQQQQHNDQVWLDNMNLNMNLNMLI